MLIRKLDLHAFKDFGEFRFLSTLPWEGTAPMPFGSGWTHLVPGQVTKKHQHHEIETYFVAYGHGQMEVDDEIVDVGPGDVIYLPPFNRHRLRNTSDSDLLFLSVYWEDMTALAKTKEETRAALGDVPAEGLSVAGTPAAETRVVALGAASLAGLAGPALAADAHARFLRQRGAAAELAVLAPAAEPMLEAAGIVRLAPTPPAERRAVVAGVLAQLHAAGRLAESSGTLVLPLGGELCEALRRYHLRAAIGPRARAALERWLAAPPEVLAVSAAPGAAGSVPLGVEGALAHAVDGELAAAAEIVDLGAGSGVWFCATEDAVRYGVVAPLLCLALDRAAALPAALVTSEGFDTAPPPSALSGLPADVQRLVLARIRPETETERVSAAKLALIAQDVVETTLPGWRDWLAELGERLAAEYHGKVPCTGLWTEEHRHFYEELKRTTAAAERAYSAATFSLQEVCRLLDGLVFSARRFARRELAWIGVPGRADERRTSIALELAAARVLAMLAAPLVPGFAGELWDRLGEAGEPCWENVPGWVAPGRELGSLASEPATASLQAI